MRTARALTVSPSMLCAGGGVCFRGVCSQEGVPESWGVPGLGGSALGSVPGPGGLLGGCTWSGGVPGPLGGWPDQVLPPVDRHMPVNILPCPKLRLRAVINGVMGNQTFGYITVASSFIDTLLPELVRHTLLLFMQPLIFVIRWYYIRSLKSQYHKEMPS